MDFDGLIKSNSRKDVGIKGSITSRMNEAQECYIDGNIYKAEKLYLDLLSVDHLSKSHAIEIGLSLYDIYIYASESPSLKSSFASGVEVDDDELDELVRSTLMDDDDDDVEESNVVESHALATIAGIIVDESHVDSLDIADGERSPNKKRSRGEESQISTRKKSKRGGVSDDAELSIHKNRKKARIVLEFVGDLISSMQNAGSFEQDGNRIHEKLNSVYRSEFGKELSNLDGEEAMPIEATELLNLKFWKDAAKLAAEDSDEDALGMYERILRVYPRDLQSNVERNRLRLKMVDKPGNHPSDIMRDCEDLQRIYPMEVSFGFQLAQAAARNGEFDKSERILLEYARNVISPVECPEIAEKVLDLSYSKTPMIVEKDSIEMLRNLHDHGLMAAKELCHVEMMDQRGNYDRVMSIINGIGKYLQTGECCNADIFEAMKERPEVFHQDLAMEVVAMYAVCLIRKREYGEAERIFQVLFNNDDESENEVLELRVRIANELIKTGERARFHRARIILEKVLELKERKHVSQSKPTMPVQDIRKQLLHVYKVLRMDAQARSLSDKIERHMKEKEKFDLEMDQLKSSLHKRFIDDNSSSNKESTSKSSQSLSSYSQISQDLRNRVLDEFEIFAMVGRQYRTKRQLRMKKSRAERMNLSTRAMELELHEDPDVILISQIIQEMDSHLQSSRQTKGNDEFHKYFLCMVGLLGDLIGDDDVHEIRESVERIRTRGKKTPCEPLPFARYKFSRTADCYFFTSLIGEKDFLDIYEETTELLCEKYDCPGIAYSLSRKVVDQRMEDDTEVGEDILLDDDDGEKDDEELNETVDDETLLETSKKKRKDKRFRWSSQDISWRIQLNVLSSAMQAGMPYETMSGLRELIRLRFGSFQQGRQQGEQSDTEKSTKAVVNLAELDEIQKNLKHAYELMWIIFNEIEIRSDFLMEPREFRLFERSVERILDIHENDASIRVCFAHKFITGNLILTRALSNYFDSLAMNPHDPLLNLCIAASYLQISCSRQEVPDRNGLILRAFAFLAEYSRLRMRGVVDDKSEVPGVKKVEDDGKEMMYKAEVLYNFGRAFHQIGMDHQAMKYYDMVLQLPDTKHMAEQRSMKQEAALNIASIMQESDMNIPFAKFLLKKHLTIKL